MLETARDFLNVTCLDGDQVQADIAKPNFEPSSLPFFAEQYAVDDIQFDVVSVGNPHCVIFSDEKSESDMMAIGRRLNAHPAFPDGVNVEFVKIIARDKIELCVYERGVGLTLACGSGACAAVAVGRRSGYLDAVVTVQQPGGVLQVIWESLDSVIQLRGVATLVFDGKITHCRF